VKPLLSVARENVHGVPVLTSFEELVGASVALGAATVGTLTDAERVLTDGPTAAVSKQVLTRLRKAIRLGHDPLGEAFCRLRSAQDRRPLGQTYTPRSIIDSMVAWAASQGEPPVRIVDPGAGSGRFVLATASRFGKANVIAADIDPLATLMLRANAAAAGLADRVQVHLGDYRDMLLPKVDGRTLYIGNPPYVRHHQIDPAWKAWLLTTAKARGHAASGLAGLHVHFFLATAEHAKPGDFGAFITSAEWLDVNYGQLVRELLLDGLGGQSLHVIDPTVAPFTDATTTGAIACFSIGSQPTSMRLRRIDKLKDLGQLSGGRQVSRQRLVEAGRWSVLTRVTPKLPEGYIELGELCRVHRGAVTGANDVWIAAADVNLPPSVLFPSVTRARDLFAAGDRLGAQDPLRRVIDLPIDLDTFNSDDRELIERFLATARTKKAHMGYVATNRRAWWSVGLRVAAPVLATYMARRPPAFVRNDVEARHINIAHGLYPRAPMESDVLDKLAAHLRQAVSLSQGRVYAGGLTKFEPKEMERIPIPTVDALREGATDAKCATATVDGGSVLR
jgi:adenine-specific DNA-methyltransferase